MIINMNKKEGYESMLYPDNQPHVRITDYQDDESVIRVICSITDSKKLLELCEITDALNQSLIEKTILKTLDIPYLMGARFDRVMQKGDSFDLRVISKIINSLHYDHVRLYDVHSDVATALIENSENLDNAFLVDFYEKENAVLIVPDAGAAKKVSKYLNWKWNLKDIVYCTKQRDISNGKIKLEVLKPELCRGRNCVIIDDLCDGGGTFNMIAEQIKPEHLTLIVTHGIFSNGFKELEKNFNEIIVSNSYNRTYDSKIVKLIEIDY